MRRHRHANVVGEQRDRGLGVAALMGLDEALEQLALGIAELAGGGPVLAPARRQVLAQGRPGALQRAVHRRDADLEQLGDLARRPVEHLAQDEHRALARRQELDHGEERQLDRLAPDHGRVRLLARRRDLGLLEQPVGIGLQPRQVAEGAERRHPPPVALDRVEAGVRRDLVEPRPEPVVALEAGAAAPRAQERLLDEVLGLLERAEHAVAVDVQLAPVALGQLGELGLGRGHGAHDRSLRMFLGRRLRRNSSAER
jgi:hypothetical protein